MPFRSLLTDVFHPKSGTEESYCSLRWEFAVGLDIGSPCCMGCSRVWKVNKRNMEGAEVRLHNGELFSDVSVVILKYLKSCHVAGGMICLNNSRD